MRLSMAATHRVLAVIFASMVLGGVAWAEPSSLNCELIASPPPMATFGGPATASPGRTELGIGVGGYGELPPTPCFHGGGTDWFVRWRRGVSQHIDLGFDLVTDNQTDGSLGATVKVAIRYQVNKGFRLEAGLGAADQGDGQSANADVAATIGTNNPNQTWNYYTSLHLAGSRGCSNPFCVGQKGTDHLPGAVVPLGVIGSTARVSENTHFVMEAGLGGIFSQEHPGPGVYLHLAFGVLFDVGRKRK